VKKNAQALLELATTALERAGANDRMAKPRRATWFTPRRMACPRHGHVARAVLLRHAQESRADGAAEPSLVADRAGVCLIDNHDGLPYVSVQWAVEEVIQRARRNGIGFSGITNRRARRRARHPPAAGGASRVGGICVHQLSRRDSALEVARSRSSAPIPHRGGLPAREGRSARIDLALTTVVAPIMMAMRQGREDPRRLGARPPWQATNDPKEAIEHGSLFPIGGAKGAMLALMFELICARAHRLGDRPEADSFFSEEATSRASARLHRHRSRRPCGTRQVTWSV